MIRLMLVAALAVLGFWNALYFSLVMHGVIGPKAKLIPALCRPEGDTCVLVTQTPQARLFFGIPNADLGLIYYAAMLMWAVVGLFAGPPPLVFPVEIVAAATVLVSLYLAYCLRFVLKTFCAMCYLGHAINLLIAVAVWLGTA